MRGAGTSGVALALAMAALPVKAQHIGWYLKGGIGPALTEKIEVDEFIGPVSGVDVELDPGIRFDIGAGYRFCEWFAAEVETGFIHNYIDELGPIDNVDDSSVGNVPLMANAIFELPTRTPFVPFAGVGVGMSLYVLSLDDVAGVDGEDSDAVFAYQALAGLRYEISERWSVNLTYKYFGTTDAEWDVEDAPGNIEFEGARTHAILFGFGMNF